MEGRHWLYPLIHALVLVLVQVVQRLRRDVSHLSYGKPVERTETDHGRTEGRGARLFHRAANSQQLPSKKKADDHHYDVEVTSRHTPITCQIRAIRISGPQPKGNYRHYTKVFAYG
jgi:hypothetical protein